MNKGQRADRERALRSENRRLKAAISAIHDALHAEDVNRAHELCEGALCGQAVSQPNLSIDHAAKTLEFTAAFNALAQGWNVRACCIMLAPSSTVANAVSLQICGDVTACKVVEGMIRGGTSTYMGDHV